ncbi:LysR family transcriptional regulator [Ralstonia sp. 1138]|uniref:LysR family transcriptional regulator n=1 Tax=Ralstonia sp. 1138 TaxID=3156423 RepID=UPI003396D68D
MDRLEAMQVLLSVTDAGSFSAAARHLGMPLTTVSRKISELESHLATRLLIRTTRQLSLTEAGASYVAACRKILGEIDEAERAATGEYATPRGELSVTAPVVFGRLHVTPLIAEFLAVYPQIDVRLSLVDRSIHLLEEHVDAAVRIGSLPDSSMVATRVGEVRRVVCASPAYLDAHGVPATPARLKSHTCVTFNALDAAQMWTFPSRTTKATNVEVHSRLVVNTAEAAIAAAAAGVGLTRVLSYQVADAVSQGLLRIVLQRFEPPPLPVHVMHAGQKPLPIKLRAFLDFLVPRLRQRCTGI